MLTRSDWDQYMGAPNEFWAGIGDRILHEEIAEQEAEFWSDFLEGKYGTGFATIDCEENRELLLQMYREATGYGLVVRSALNEFWRKLAITHSVFERGFINPHEEEEVVDDRPRDARGRLMSPKAIQWRDWTAWVSDPETSMRMIQEKRRTDGAFREFYEHHSAAERTPVEDGVENLNARQVAPSVTTPTSRRVPSPEVQRFAADYRTMSSEQLKSLLSPGLNPLGATAAKHNQELFDQACAFGLI